ncbi:hypothetical protein E1B28_002383 [Marasmius oreades]|uniref:Uncharacterized protein n=1 Tax=Marasmius oreades TaxID=181124 RepID=A0A9P7RMI8_9AGAR|nr:uncharacterized protein E1B28_002383 [Marasmius oreades]KAG7086429.1 hypothetical protein E1B28_002383 [Marasmius oreades]
MVDAAQGLFYPEVIDALFNKVKFPKMIEWMTRLTDRLELSRKGLGSKRSPIDGREAAREIAEASHEPDETIGFDEIEAQWLGVKQTQMVRVRPDDSGKEWPHLGKLISMNQEEFCLESQGSLGTFRVHFPRIGFSVETA